MITLLNRAVEHYAYAKECFEAWQTQHAKTNPHVKAALHDGHGKPKPEAQQLEYLRYQIEMRVLGLGWTEYATRWSSKADTRIGTVAHLQTLLEEIMLEERSARCVSIWYIYGTNCAIIFSVRRSVAQSHRLRGRTLASASTAGLADDRGCRLGSMHGVCACASEMRVVEVLPAP